jgi:hypothetical protein
MTDPKTKPKQDVNYNHQDEDIDWLDQSIRDDYYKKRPDWLGGKETEDEFWSHTD